MKRFLALAGGVVVLAGIAVLWQQRSKAEMPRAGPEAVLGVAKLMRGVDGYRGAPVQVEGVVSFVDSDAQLLALIDVEEFRQCDLAHCALVLPVRWTGVMPQVREAVRVKGTVQEEDGKFLFAAQILEKAVPADKSR
jgi:hypothetical protein